MPVPTGSFDAIVLTGGQSRRLGGVDKATTRVGGRTLLERVTAAVASAAHVVVVGAEVGGGPVAAIAAGLASATAPDIVVIAADLPFLTAAAVGQLRGALTTGVALAVDDGGEDQRLCAAWRAEGLRYALAAIGDATDASVRRLIAAAPDVVRLHLTGDPPPWFDCDMPDDLARAQRWAEERGL